MVPHPLTLPLELNSTKKKRKIPFCHMNTLSKPGQLYGILDENWFEGKKICLTFSISS